MMLSLFFDCELASWEMLYGALAFGYRTGPSG